jgi:signal transduction histidine kinase
VVNVAAAGATWRLADADDRWLTGTQATLPPTSVSRLITGNGAAWTLQVAPGPSPAGAGGRRAILVAALVAVLAFVWGATYFMARAIRREAAVRRLQSDFVAAVSHEFRSPLTTMRQMAEMLDADRVPTVPRRRQYYQVLVAETARLQRIVETLLNFGRMEAASVRYQPADLDTAALVRAVVAEVRSQPGQTGRRVEIHDPPLPVSIKADEAAARLALRNLVENAVKYSPAGTTVRMSWRLDGDRVALEVRDEGPGIAPDEQRTIFGTFVRGRAAAGGRIPGTGLGLAMVQRIAIAHGGEVRVASTPGQGSTFTLVLPRAVVGHTDASVSAPAARPLDHEV